MAERSGDGGARWARGPRALAAMLPRVAGPALRRRGFSESKVITDWPEIIGAELARETMPERLTFPRGAGAGGTEAGGVLRIRAAGPLALELQHLEPLVLDRINRYFGYKAVAKLAFVQAPLGGTQRKVKEKPRAPLTPADVERLAASVADIEDDSLKAALKRLGASVMSEKRR